MPLARFPLSILVALAVANHALAGGLEKPIFWSGHWAPLGGASASAVQGSESAYFNPAGLTLGKAKIELSADLSPTSTQSTAGFISYTSDMSTSTVVSATSSRGIAPPLGLTASYHEDGARWALGASLGVVGGSNSSYDQLDLGSLGSTQLKSLTSNSATTFQALGQSAIVELSTGASYEATDWLRIGLAWRMTGMSSNLQTLIPTSVVLAGATPSTVPLLADFRIQDLMALNYGGIRAGIQVGPKNGTWGMGATWRSQVNFNLAGTSVPGLYVGTSTSVSLSGGGTFTLEPGYKLNSTGGDVAVTTLLPQQINLGGHWEFLPQQKLFFQYTFTENHKNDQFGVKGSISTKDAQGNVILTDLPSITLNWKNANELRLGYEYSGFENLPLRGGFVYSTSSTDPASASSSALPPGAMTTFLLGTGRKLTDPNIEINGGLEYGRATGIGNVPYTTQTTEYKFDAIALHAGVKYCL